MVEGKYPMGKETNSYIICCFGFKDERPSYFTQLQNSRAKYQTRLATTVDIITHLVQPRAR